MLLVMQMRVMLAYCTMAGARDGDADSAPDKFDGGTSVGDEDAVADSV